MKPEYEQLIIPAITTLSILIIWILIKANKIRKENAKNVICCNAENINDVKVGTYWYPKIKDTKINKLELAYAPWIKEDTDFAFLVKEIRNDFVKLKIMSKTMMPEEEYRYLNIKDLISTHMLDVDEIMDISELVFGDSDEEIDDEEETIFVENNNSNVDNSLDEKTLININGVDYVKYTVTNKP
jgi:hypothetical protein